MGEQIAVGFEHDALLYDGLDEYVAATSDFIEAGYEADEPVMVAVPGAKIPLLREALNGHTEGVRFVDMNRLGQNPGRIIPEVREWVAGHGSHRCRFIGEPIWPGRSQDETIEATRHEALINLAFSRLDVHILCPYDTHGLERTVVADAERTHPHLICGHQRRRSDCFANPLDIWRASDWCLAEPGEVAGTIAVTDDLALIRSFVSSHAGEAGLGRRRLADLVLAVNEAATNALLHGRPPAQLRIWRDPDSVVCEISDEGQLDDPLAGRQRPGPDWPSGRGVWLINQMCDLVELRPGETGTTIRMHVAVDR